MSYILAFPDLSLILEKVLLELLNDILKYIEYLLLSMYLIKISYILNGYGRLLILRDIINRQYWSYSYIIHLVKKSIHLYKVISLSGNLE